MAAAPQLKIYDQDGNYEGAVKHAETAAAIIAGVGQDGWTIRDGHGKRDIVWTEGAESQPAAESYDRVAGTVYQRIRDRRYDRADRLGYTVSA